MKLKKIVLHGFKSFADRTVIEFADGITAIVGPNGCGKSNISDGFLWVSGSKSAKSLRGTQMLDVIFSGTGTRNPMNYAEVSISLTDIDGELPIDYREVTITRRLHRNGESEYLINRNPVRMKDVLGLLMDSGIGKDSVSIFEQGKIDRMITLSPVERRSVFEEAAGIHRYKVKKQEALKRLEPVSQNVDRLSDISGEVSKQIDVLEKQAKLAREFKENQELLITLERGVALAKWDQLAGQVDQGDGQEDELKKALEASQRDLEICQKNLTDAKEALAVKEKTLKERSEALYQAKSHKAIKTKEQQTNKEKLEETVNRRKKLEAELAELVNKRDAAKKVYTQNKARLEDLAKDFLAKEAEAKKSREALEKGESSVAKLREEQTSAHNQRLQLVHKEHESQSRLQKAQVKLEGTDERQREVNKQLSGINAKIDLLKLSVTEKESGFEATKGEVHTAGAALQEAEKGKKDQEKILAELDKESKVIHQSLTQSQARERVLRQLQDEMEGYSAGAKRLLKESQSKKSALFGKLTPIYEAVKLNKGSEALAASAMRPYEETLVVSTRVDLEEVVAFAKANKLKDFSLLCLEDLPKRENLTKKLEGLTDLIGLMGQGGVADRICGSVVIAEDPFSGVKTACESGIDVVTRDGWYIDSKGILFYATQGEQNLFLREAELRKLQTEREEQEQKLKRHTELIESGRKRLEEILKTIRDLDGRVRKGEMKLVEANFSLQQAKEELQKSVNSEKSLQEDAKRLASAIDEMRKEIVELEKEYTKNKEEADRVSQKSGSVEGKLKIESEQLAESRRLHNERQQNFQRVASEKRQLEHTLDLFQVKDEENEQQQKRVHGEISGLAQVVDQVTAQGTDFSSLLQEADAALSSAETAMKEADIEVKSAKKEIEQVEKKIESAEKDRKAQEKSLYSVGLKLAQITAAMQAIEKDLDKHHNLTVAQTRSLGIVLKNSLDDEERRIRQLRKSLEEAGDINMTSIEEYEKHKERQRYLSSQLEDLNLSKSELLAIIAELDGQSRKQFQETFEQIRMFFQKNFKILFNGGEADLTFTEGEDVLEAGIEIIAKPPGKKMRSITLLSGGEKCLTAMALLFAIFEVKPAPFCILDEIDAPLDDQNISRFVNMVRQFTDRSQFIIITHNKRTMAIADRIFGISMQERGVSKILSMEFSHHEEKELATVDQLSDKED